MNALRIVSINTGKGDGAYRHRLDLLATGLAALQPDIVLVQEALKSADGSLDTLQLLADRLGLHPSFAPARFKPREVEREWYDTWSGIGMLSNRVPDAITSIELPPDPRDGDRVALVAQFGDLQVATVHLTHLHDPDADLIRRRQIETVLGSSVLNAARHVLIGGDFNQPLPGIMPLLAGIGDWTATDAFGENVANRTTVPVTAPLGEGRCVDYIFSLTKPGQTVPSFSDSNVVLAGPDASGIYPSDHRGVMTVVSFSRTLEQPQ